MSWKQIVGLLILCAIVLLPLWPRRRKRKKPGGPDHFHPSTTEPGVYGGGGDLGSGDGGGHGGH